jgi:hypothetical protein
MKLKIDSANFVKKGVCVTGAVDLRVHCAGHFQQQADGVENLKIKVSSNFEKEFLTSQYSFRSCCFHASSFETANKEGKWRRKATA